VFARGLSSRCTEPDSRADWKRILVFEQALPNRPATWSDETQDVGTVRQCDWEQLERAKSIMISKNKGEKNEEVARF
jgi:hypothetical protein